VRACETAKERKSACARETGRNFHARQVLLLNDRKLELNSSRRAPRLFKYAISCRELCRSYFGRCSFLVFWSVDTHTLFRTHKHFVSVI
jgi:hypothetical protein